MERRDSTERDTHDDIDHKTCDDELDEHGGNYAGEIRRRNNAEGSDLECHTDEKEMKSEGEGDEGGGVVDGESLRRGGNESHHHVMIQNSEKQNYYFGQLPMVKQFSLKTDEKNSTFHSQ